MTWLPTTNLIQTDLLTPEQLAALKAWPHGYEYYYGDGVWDDGTPTWLDDAVYRGKLAPVVTSVWFNVYKNSMSKAYELRAHADYYAAVGRINVLRNDTCNGVTTSHLEGLK